MNRARPDAPFSVNFTQRVGLNSPAGQRNRRRRLGEGQATAPVRPGEFHSGGEATMKLMWVLGPARAAGRGGKSGGRGVRHGASGLFILALLGALMFAAAPPAPARAADSFVAVKGHRFYIGRKPHYFVGTNYWYGGLLGLEKDRRKGAERLRRELDFLRANGVTNLRLMAGAEGSGMINGVVRVGPPLQPRQGEFDERVLDGLDLVLAEMGKRGMKAVVFFSNNWEWSGGFQQYLSWNGLVPDGLRTRKLTWDEQRDVVSRFYACEPCKQSYNKQVNLILGRVNKYSRKRYTEDPAIMAWELANEPRPMRPAAADAYRRWVADTAAMIKAKDRNHLVTIGHEGYMGTDDMKLFEQIHADANVDYLTIHIWPKNWGWFKGHEIAEGFADVFEKTSRYIEEHLRVAEKLDKPLVVEEFGLPRDGHSFEVNAPTTLRDALYGRIFSVLEQHAASGGHVAGANFWAFGGEARPVKGQTFWKEGDDYMGDPPMEEQGLNTVFDSDLSTWALISGVSKSLERSRNRPFKPSPAPRSPAGRAPAPVVFKGDGDRRHMMGQLGIRALWPGADPSEPPTCDGADAYSYPLLEPRVAKNGLRVTTPARWAHIAKGRGYASIVSVADSPRGRRAARGRQPSPTTPSAEGPRPLGRGGEVKPNRDSADSGSANQSASGQEPAADRPVARADRNSMLAHAELLEKRKKGRIDVYFLGDSITRRWGTSDEQHKALLANWRRNFYGWNAANFGWGGDTTQNILWRLHNGELDNVNPKVIVLMAGTNNVGDKSPQGPNDPRIAGVARGIRAILDVCRRKAPRATVVLMGITPRNDNMAVMPVVNRINERIAKFADGKRIRYVNINDRLAGGEGRLYEGMAERDGLHLDVKGYQVWADALKPIFSELLGPPAKEDHAPPPTGDPSARTRPASP
jgi:lysophospholipase L1-like esterase